MYLARLRGYRRPAGSTRSPKARALLPAAIDVVLNTSDEIRTRRARAAQGAERALHRALRELPDGARGGAKLKEISYIHAEGYPAGEMKHGPIALLDSSVPVVGIVTRRSRAGEDALEPREAKAREAPIILVANHGDEEAAAIADHVFWVPKVDELLSPIVNVIPLQLLAYHIADIEGKDVDQPRNLAKTVTVE